MNNEKKNQPRKVKNKPLTTKEKDELAMIMIETMDMQEYRFSIMNGDFRQFDTGKCKSGYC